MVIPDSLFDALYEGRGLQYIVDLCAKVLKNPICITAPGFITITEDSLFDSPFRQYADQNSTYISKQAFLSLHKTSRFEKMLSSPEAIFYSPNTPPQDGYPNSAPLYARGFIDCAIRIRGTFVGWICVIGTEQAVTPKDAQMVSEIAKLISCELQKNEFFSLSKGGMFDYFMYILLEHQTTDDALLSQYMQTLGKQLSQEKCVAVVQALTPQKSFTNDLQQTLRTFFPNSISGLYKDRIVILLSCRENGLPIMYQKPLNTFLQTSGLKIGISNPYSSISYSHAFYLQACNSLRLGIQFDAEKSIYLYCDYVVFHGIEINEDQISPKDACLPVIWDLAFSEDPGDQELLQTLWLYLYYVRDTKRVAAAMQIHRNTLYYRLQKLRDMFGKDLDTGFGDFRIRYSFRLLEYYFGKYQNDYDFPYVSPMIERENRLHREKNDVL